jgi:uncharacterized protein (TIGR02246 family)
MSPEDLIDIEAIKQLKARYFRLLDTQAWAAWADVFTEDARLQWGPDPDQVMEGRETIVAGVSAALEGAVTCHHGHMPEIELLGPDSARGIWAMFDRVDHPRYDLRGYGHYHEVYVRTTDGWRIGSTKLVRLREDRTPKPLA